MTQEAWSIKAERNPPFPGEMQNDFQKWYNELKQLSKLKIKRRIGYGNKENWSLQDFATKVKAHTQQQFLCAAKRRTEF